MGKAMTATSNTHGPAENQMATGYTLDGFPSMGAWVSYALGTDNQDLPAFVAIPDPRGVPQVGPRQHTERLVVLGQVQAGVVDADVDSAKCRDGVRDGGRQGRRVVRVVEQDVARARAVQLPA